MIKADKKKLKTLEKQYPGIGDQIQCFEAANLPECPRCGSDDTADVQGGITGRTMHIADATTKFKLIPNGPKPSKYFCNACNKYFTQAGRRKFMRA